jgi:putative effector of murein hydrolase LrgA (UPF0299 family)
VRTANIYICLSIYTHIHTYVYIAIANSLTGSCLLQVIVILKIFALKYVAIL